MCACVCVCLCVCKRHGMVPSMTQLEVMIRENILALKSVMESIYPLLPDVISVNY